MFELCEHTLAGAACSLGQEIETAKSAWFAALILYSLRLREEMFALRNNREINQEIWPCGDNNLVEGKR